MPRSPLPQRHGLDAAWLRTPAQGSWASLRDHLVERLPYDGAVQVDRMLAAGRFVDEHGAPLPPDAPFVPNRMIWFHRELRDEPVVPGEIPVLYRDERIVVVDKPHFCSTIPRGRHVMQSVLVRLRDRLGLPELGAAHRLDRLTAGVLLLTTERRWRAPYQGLFEHRQVTKTYRALAPLVPGLPLAAPVEVRSHLRKDRGVLQGYAVPDAPPNAHTTIELIKQLGTGEGAYGEYLLRPHTGKTHQLRLHLAGLGAPILGDPLYPTVRDVDIDDFSTPLQLLAATLGFTDPVDGTARTYRSERRLTP